MGTFAILDAAVAGLTAVCCSGMVGARSQTQRAWRHIVKRQTIVFKSACGVGIIAISLLLACIKTVAPSAGRYAGDVAVTVRNGMSKPACDMVISVQAAPVRDFGESVEWLLCPSTDEMRKRRHHVGGRYCMGACLPPGGTATYKMKPGLYSFSPSLGHTVELANQPFHLTVPIELVLIETPANIAPRLGPTGVTQHFVYYQQSYSSSSSGTSSEAPSPTEQQACLANKHDTCGDGHPPCCAGMRCYDHPKRDGSLQECHPEEE